MTGHNSSQLLTKVQENTADMSDDKRAILVESKLTTHLFNLTHPLHVFSYSIFCILMDIASRAWVSSKVPIK